MVEETERDRLIREAAEKRAVADAERAKAIEAARVQSEADKAESAAIKEAALAGRQGIAAPATVEGEKGQTYQQVNPTAAAEAFGVEPESFGIVVQENETKAGSPNRVPEEMAVGDEVYHPLVKEHDPLGTTDGEEPRVVADDLLKEIQRPIKPSALGESHADALVGSEDEDMEADHDSRIIVSDPRNDLPEQNGVKVVQVNEESVVKPEDV